MFDKIVDQLKEIKATSGMIQKTKLVSQYIKDEDFKKIIVLMLNPFLTFGVSNLDRLPVVEAHHFEEEDFYKTFAAMADRKLTGGDALIALSKLWSAGVDPWLMNNICNKQTGAGFGVAVVNKVVPKLIPTFPYMRCSRPDQVKKPLPWADGVYVEVKEDGMFINLDHDYVGVVSARTRQGSPLPVGKIKHFEHNVKVSLAEGTQTHGELVVYKAGVLMPRALGNGLINSIIEGASFAEDEEVVFVVWDQIPLECVVPKGRCNVPYKTRFEPLTKLGTDGYGIRCIEYEVCYSPEQARKFLRKVLLAGGEGTVEKDPEMPWEDRTSPGQIKRKVEAIADLKIKGYRPGKGKNAELFGAIICCTSDDLLEAAIGISSMSEEEALWVHKNRERLLGTIVAVKYNAITEPSDSNPIHSLFLPRCEEFRKDKLEADTLEKVKAEYQSALENA